MKYKCNQYENGHFLRRAINRNFIRKLRNSSCFCLNLLCFQEFNVKVLGDANQEWAEHTLDAIWVQVRSETQGQKCWISPITSQFLLDCRSEASKPNHSCFDFTWWHILRNICAKIQKWRIFALYGRSRSLNAPDWKPFKDYIINV